MVKLCKCRTQCAHLSLISLKFNIAVLRENLKEYYQKRGPFQTKAKFQTKERAERSRKSHSTLLANRLTACD